MSSVKFITGSPEEFGDCGWDCCCCCVCCCRCVVVVVVAAVDVLVMGDTCAVVVVSEVGTLLLFVRRLVEGEVMVMESEGLIWYTYEDSSASMLSTSVTTAKGDWANFLCSSLTLMLCFRWCSFNCSSQAFSFSLYFSCLFAVSDPNFRWSIKNLNKWLFESSWIRSKK